jgi:hypothetical protein
MTYKPKSAREKMEGDHGLPKVVDIPPKMQKTFGKGKMVVPAPLQVDAMIRKVKRGQLVTPKLIRKALARDFKADTCCPMTSGIFIRLSAEAAEEDMEAGRKKITPYWRVVTDEGCLIDKFPGGALSQARILEKEGLQIITIKGQKRVRDFGKFLAII